MITNTIISGLPKTPGVYLFYDQNNRILYVGKAVSLKARVASYFQNNVPLGPKTKALVSKIVKIGHIDVGSELEALLLEAELIKRHRPPYNISLKDDKAYQYIVIRGQKSGVRKQIPESRKQKTDNRVQADVFCVGTARKIDVKDKSTLYFGPFPDGTTVRQVLRQLRRIFKFCDCSVNKFSRYQKLGRPCIFGNIGLCLAPCTANITIDNYNKNIKRLVKFLKSGQKDPIIRDLKRQMARFSIQKRYEEAAVLRDQIDRFEYVTQHFRQATEFLANPNLEADQQYESVAELLSVLGITVSIGEKIRIEGYDISHLGGEQMVGSLVVFIDGKPSKDHYRRFKIKNDSSINDVAALTEVLTRRFHNDWPFPQILLVDGGKPQVSVAKKVIKDFGLTNKITLVGLAKKQEEIVTSAGAVLRLERRSRALNLLQSIRDESHRFANSYRKKLMR